jgi:hypothetical protein
MIISDDNVHRYITNHGWDWCNEYGEPGYNNFGTSFVVLGNYWCRCDHPPKGDGLHALEDHHPLFWRQLESQGVQFEWEDEWVIDDHPDRDRKAYRLHGDSYDWQPSALYGDDDQLLTPDSSIEEWIDGFCANNPQRCLPARVFSGDDLEAAGFVRHNGQFESGWFDGQTDNPVKIHAAIRAEHPDHTIVFALDETSQFYTKFSAYHRPPRT